jgi:hypothetical protein
MVVRSIGPQKAVHSSLSIAEADPVLASQWLMERNGEHHPDHVHFLSDIEVWWRCLRSDDHVWKASIKHRFQTDPRCPFCCAIQSVQSIDLKHASAERNSTRGRAQIVGRTDEPNILRYFERHLDEWHPYKNRSDISEATARDSVWWQCKQFKSHVWKATIYERVKRKLGCPMCFRKKKTKRIPLDRSLAHRFPKIAREWHPTRNGKLSPVDVGAMSDRTVWWQCKNFKDHTWQARIDKRTHRGRSCPHCREKSIV